MFKVAVSPTYIYPVTVEFPGNSGKTEKRTFDAEFKRLNQAEVEEVYRRLSAGELSDDLLVKEVLYGWGKVFDDEGKPLDFNEDNLEILMQVFPTRPATVKAFFDSISGAKAKN